MAKAKNTTILEEEMSPERRARIAARVREANAEILLAELRKLQEMTQTDLAEALGVGQPNIARMEQADDIQISTLARAVKALGARMSITIEVPGKGTFVLGQFGKQPAA